MKKVLISLFMIMFFGSQAQQPGKAIIDPDLNREILQGWVSRADIASKDYLEDEKLKYEAYTADKESVETIKKAFASDKKLNILLVFATWCGDSKMHVPEFFKVADLAQIKKVKYLAVNRKKNAADIDMSKMDIQRVPTFIVYRGDVEIGRIIESPLYTIEKDLAGILSK